MDARRDDTEQNDEMRSLWKRARGDLAMQRTAREVTRELNAGLSRVEGSVRAVDQAIGRVESMMGSQLAAHLSGLAAAEDAHIDRLVERLGQGPFDRANASVRSRFQDPRPWMVPEAVDFVCTQLDEGMTALEWGGGASTPFWCERVGTLHTVEASPGWALVLLDYMSKRLTLVDRWRLHFVGANWANTQSTRRRTGRSMPAAAYKQRLEDDYALFLPDPVDIVIMDGAARQRTALRTAQYIERDATPLVVVDNMEEEYVAGSIDALELGAYARHDFWGTKPDAGSEVGQPHCTTVFVRRGWRPSRSRDAQ